jgi:hypothetical protein
LESVTNGKSTLDAFVNCAGVGRYLFLVLPGERHALRLREIAAYGHSKPRSCDSLDFKSGCDGGPCTNLSPTGWGKRGKATKAGGFVHGSSITGDVGGPSQCADGFIASGAMLSCPTQGGTATADGQICTQCRMEEWNPRESARESSDLVVKFGLRTNRNPFNHVTCRQLDVDGDGDGCTGVSLTLQSRGRDGKHWFQMDAGDAAPIDSVIVQRPWTSAFLTEFNIQASLDGKQWSKVTSVNGSTEFSFPKDWRGPSVACDRRRRNRPHNCKRSPVVNNKFHAQFQKPVFARYVRVANMKFSSQSSNVAGRFGLVSCRAGPVWKKTASDTNLTCSELNNNLIKVDWTVSQAPYDRVTHCQQLCVNQPGCTAIFYPAHGQGMRIDSAGKDISGCYLFRNCDVESDHQTIRDGGDASVSATKPFPWRGDTYEIQGRRSTVPSFLQLGSENTGSRTYQQVSQHSRPPRTQTLQKEVVSSETKLAKSAASSPGMSVVKSRGSLLWLL